MQGELIKNITEKRHNKVRPKPPVNPQSIIYTIKPGKEAHGLLFFIRPLDGLLFKEVTFANSRGWLFKINAASIEISDDYKTVSKTTTQIFEPRNMLKCKIILKKIRTSLFSVLKRSPRASYEMGVFWRLKWGGGGGGTSFRGFAVYSPTFPSPNPSH